MVRRRNCSERWLSCWPRWLSRVALHIPQGGDPVGIEGITAAVPAGTTREATGRANTATEIGIAKELLTLGEYEHFWPLELDLHEDHWRVTGIHDIVLDASGSVIACACGPSLPGGRTTGCDTSWSMARPAPPSRIHGFLQAELVSLIRHHLRESRSHCLALTNPGVVPI